MNRYRAEEEHSINRRDARDIARIALLHDAAHNCICAIAFCDPLEHPDAKFHPDDLRGTLRGVMQDLAGELIRITRAHVQVPSDVDITAGVREFADE